MRVFVAIELDDAVRATQKAVQEGLGRSCSEVRWIPANHLHVTLKFLGEVPDGDVSKVVEAVGRAAAGADPFDMTLAGSGCFPPRGPVRIVWAGLQAESGGLSAGVEAVETELEQIGFARERRPFSPHITIGRVREDRSGGRIRAGAEAFTFAPVAQAVDSITLMSSVLSPKGPTYTPVSRVSLQ